MFLFFYVSCLLGVVSDFIMLGQYSLRIRSCKLGSAFIMGSLQRHVLRVGYPRLRPPRADPCATLLIDLSDLRGRPRQADVHYHQCVSMALAEPVAGRVHVLHTCRATCDIARGVTG
jgi:hypothetical protein